MDWQHCQDKTLGIPYLASMLISSLTQYNNNNFIILLLVYYDVHNVDLKNIANGHFVRLYFFFSRLGTKVPRGMSR